MPSSGLQSWQHNWCAVLNGPCLARSQGATFCTDFTDYRFRMRSTAESTKYVPLRMKFMPTVEIRYTLVPSVIISNQPESLKGGPDPWA